MGRRKFTPAHNFWHPRVEGQIKHTIGRHPEWFNLPAKTSAKKDCIGSLAKRIVGEIIAATVRGNNAGHDESNCSGQINDADATNVSRRRVRRLKGVAAPLRWYDASKVVPEKGGPIPYLVTYRSGTGRIRVTTSVWAGEKKGWIFLTPRFKNGLSENVKYWAKYPEPPKS